MVLQYVYIYQESSKCHFFSGSIVVFHWGHVGGRISILKIKRTKLREIASRPGLGVPKFGLRAIPIHIYTYIFNKIAILEGMSKCLHKLYLRFEFIHRYISVHSSIYLYSCAFLYLHLSS